MTTLEEFKERFFNTIKICEEVSFLDGVRMERLFENAIDEYTKRVIEICAEEDECKIWLNCKLPIDCKECRIIKMTKAVQEALK